jgi:hypothetical protein
VPVLTSGRLAAATSILALVVAMGGTGYAAVKIKGNQIARNAITSAKVKNDSLTGKDVKESSLGTVPSAQTAASAGTAANAAKVNGLTLSKVHYRGNQNGPVVVFNGNGLVITANCDVGKLSLDATTSKPRSSIFGQLVDIDSKTVLAKALEGGHFGSETLTFSLLSGADQSQLDPALITFEYDALDGSEVSGTLSTDGDPDGENHCSVAGTITAG